MRTPRAVLLAAALAFAGCRRPEGPAEAYRAFAAAARAGDADGVWARLSGRSRAALDARAAAAAAQGSGVVPASGKDLVVGDLSAEAPRIEKVTVARESREEAVLAVEVQGAPAPQQVSLVRESGGWRVVLPFDN